MKRILVYYTQFVKVGGIESHLSEFCRQMACVGVEVDLVILNSQMFPENEAFLRRICRQVYLCKLGRSPVRFLWLFQLGVQLMATHYDAFYTNGQGESVAFLARFVRHGGCWVHHHHMTGDEADRKTWRNGYRKVMQKADKIVVCSRQIAINMGAALKRKVNVVTCFSHKIELRQEVIPGPKKIRFGYYGRLIPEKGIEIICRLSEDPDLKDYEFHIWGEGNVYPLSFFERFPKLRFHGAFSGRDGLTRVMESIDAVLLLSTNLEGLPICLLEAMGAGLPWLATDRGGIPDIACDPISTRVISATATYDEIKKAVLLLAADLRSGKISKVTQIETYNNNFSSSVLIGAWKEILGLTESPLPVLAK